MNKSTMMGQVSDSLADSTFFAIFKYKSYLFRKLFKPLVYMSVLTGLFCLAYESGWIDFGDSLTLPSFMGAALGILLVFRNNTAYDRWWEARKVLGGLVNTSRSFAMQTNQLLDELQPRQQLISLIAAFPYALKEHLREGVILSEISFIDKEHSEEVANASHKPNALASIMGRIIHDQKREGKLSDYEAIKLHDDIQLLIDILGKCERIRNTPMPASHNYLLKFYTFIYTLTLPVTFVGLLHWWSILAVASIYFVMMSIITIAEEIENPFGHDANDLPVDKIAQTIHRNVVEIGKSKVSDIPEVNSEIA